MRLFSFLLAGFLLSGGLLDAQAPENGGSLGTRGADARSIIFDVIAGAKGGGAGGLVLTANGSKVEASVSASSETSQDVFVLDALNSSLAELARSEEALAAYLRGGGGHLKRAATILIVADTARAKEATGPVTDTTTLKSKELFVHRIPASTDGLALVRALEEYKPGLQRILQAQGGDGEAERVRLSLQALSFIATAEVAVPGAKLVIWMSPGWPFLAGAEAKSSDGVFDSIVYFSDLLRSARMVLYAISPQGVTSQDSSGQTEAFLLATRPGSIQNAGHAPRIPVQLTDSYYKGFVKGARTANEANPNALSLQVLAVQSGGLLMQQNNDLKAQIARCTADADGLVELRYTPAGGGGYHELQVRRPGSGEALRTRSGFYLK